MRREQLRSYREGLLHKIKHEMASCGSSGNSSDSTVEPSTNLELETVDFNYEDYVTDFLLVVEDKKLYVTRAVLIEASPFFREKCTEEKTSKKLELPEEKYPRFNLFLQYIHSRKYTLTEPDIDEILPLADSYEVKSLLKKCENWLLTELKLKNAKVRPHYQGEEDDVRYLMKCLYYGEEYSLEDLYKKSFTMALPYKLQRYRENKHYRMLPEKNKRELLEMRLIGIEEDVAEKTGIGMSGSGGTDFSKVQVELCKCSSTLFL